MAAILALLSAILGGIGSAVGVGHPPLELTSRSVSWGGVGTAVGYPPLDLGFAVVWAGVAFGIHRRVAAVGAAALALVVLTRLLPAVIVVQPAGIFWSVLATFLFWDAYRVLRALPRPAGAADAG